MSSSEIVALHTLLLPLRSILRTRSPAHHTAESRHATDIAAVSTVCLCPANSGLGQRCRAANVVASVGGLDRTLAIHCPSSPAIDRLSDSHSLCRNWRVWLAKIV